MWRREVGGISEGDHLFVLVFVEAANKISIEFQVRLKLLHLFIRKEVVLVDLFTLARLWKGAPVIDVILVVLATLYERDKLRYSLLCLKLRHYLVRAHHISGTFLSFHVFLYEADLGRKKVILRNTFDRLLPLI